MIYFSIAFFVFLHCSRWERKQFRSLNDNRKQLTQLAKGFQASHYGSVFRTIDQVLQINISLKINILNQF